MKKLLALLLALGIVSISICSFAGDPVDLRGKQGVVDPKDLKQSDPKPSKVEGKASPSPNTGNSSSNTPPTIGGSASGSAGSGGGVNVPITHP
ncbi:MAG: hypothetical protein HGA99_04890 [Chlorobiaceae bacterium]|nr:hypothetical protein [Chlorobiaceae bacterium]